MLRMRVTALVMAAIPIGVGHAETDAACQPVEVAAPGFFVGETTLAGVPIKFSASTSYQFSESELDGKKMMAIDEIVKMDMEDLRTKWPAIASNKVPPSSCDDRYKPHGFSLRNEGGKSALGTMAVTYENWSCKWTYGTCTTTGRKHGIPYPKLYKCKWEVKNKNFQKTVDIKTRFSPVIKDGNLSIDVASSLDDRGGIPDGLLNVVGVLTLNVGSKFMRDNYEATIDSIRAQLPKFEYAPPDFAENADVSDFRALANLRLTTSYFAENDGRLTLVLISKGSTKYNTGCFLQNSLIRLAK